jgi:hypothetical protein
LYNRKKWTGWEWNPRPQLSMKAALSRLPRYSPSKRSTYGKRKVLFKSR